MTASLSQPGTLSPAAFHDPKFFEAEQRAVGERRWGLIGPAEWVAQDGDWMTGMIAGRDVFVQRFGERLVGFENVCSHRFSQLRSERRGRGPIRCPYHGWAFNAEGVPLGIPHCRELFGVSPHELRDRRLKPLAVEQSGPFVFARSDLASTETVSQSLGRWSALLAALGSRKLELFWAPEKIMKANWKLAFENTLEDYHIVEVHPTNFGRNGWNPPASSLYEEDGVSSAMMTKRPIIDPSITADQVIRALAAGEPLPVQYVIFHFFPDLAIDISFGRCIIMTRYEAVSSEETRLRSFAFDLVPPGGTPLSESRREYLRGFFNQVLDEDSVTVERWSRGLRQAWGPRLHGLQERRIGHFERCFASLLAAGGVAP